MSPRFFHGILDTLRAKHSPSFEAVRMAMDRRVTISIGEPIFEAVSPAELQQIVEYRPRAGPLFCKWTGKKGQETVKKSRGHSCPG